MRILHIVHCIVQYLMCIAIHRCTGDIAIRILRIVYCIVRCLMYIELHRCKNTWKCARPIRVKRHVASVQMTARMTSDSCITGVCLPHAFTSGLRYSGAFLSRPN